jgi:hypothetical protein
VRAGAVVADHAGLPNGRTYRSVIPETTYG